MGDTIGSEASASRYARRSRRWALAALGADLAYLWALPTTGVAQAWARQLADWSPWPWAVVVYVTGLALPWTLAMAPVAWARGFRLEHQFGLSRERWTAWAWRWLKGQALGGLLLGVLAVALAGTLRWAPATWWLWTTTLWILWSVVLTQWMPVLLLPLFYRQRPVGDPALTARLHAVARAGGTAIQGVYEIEFSRQTVKANACLCGLGATRRVLLTDTMTRQFSVPEIEAVFAHELGHQQLRHLPWGLALNAAALLASGWLVAQWLPRGLSAWGISEMASLAVLPVVALGFSLVGVVLTPLQHGLSRRFERAADRFALTLTQAPEHFIAAMEKLARQNLAEATVSRWVEWWWYDHPPIAQRVAMARQYVQ